MIYLNMKDIKSYSNQVDVYKMNDVHCYRFCTIHCYYNTEVNMTSFTCVLSPFDSTHREKCQNILFSNRCVV